MTAKQATNHKSGRRKKAVRLESGFGVATASRRKAAAEAHAAQRVKGGAQDDPIKKHGKFQEEIFRKALRRSSSKSSVHS